MLPIARHQVAYLSCLLAQEAAERRKGVEPTIAAPWAASSKLVPTIEGLIVCAVLDHEIRQELEASMRRMRDAPIADAPMAAPSSIAELQNLCRVTRKLANSRGPFEPSKLGYKTYQIVVRGTLQAWLAEPRTIGQTRSIERIAKYASIELPQARIGLAMLADERLITYESVRDYYQEAFAVVDDRALRLKLQTLEEAGMLECDISIPYAEPLRSDYEQLVRGIARQHKINAVGVPTGTELIVTIEDLTGDEDAFAANATAFEEALTSILAQSTPMQPATSITIHGNMSGSAIQTGSPGATQTVRTNLGADMSKVRECAEHAVRAFAQESLDDDTRDVVDTQLAQVNKQLAKEAPNPKLLLPMATTALTALSAVGAAGKGVDYLNQLIHYLQSMIS